MIKFFRKIRYDLMEKNKTGKYLKYAIGEIVLVIVGIIIALQINNWNQDRLTQNRIESRLLNLIGDVENEVEEMDEVKESAKLRIIIIHEILKRNDKLKSIGWPDSISGQVAIDTIRNPNSILSSLKTFDGNRPTYNELINSGEFYTIRNETLKRKIQNYYGSIDELRDAERWNNQETSLKIRSTKERLGIGAFSKATLDELVELAKNDKQFGAELETEINLDYTQKSNLEALKQEALSLIEAIKSEIK